MNFKYECKRFQRNHQLLNSTSHKILNVSFDSKENNHAGSIMSMDDSHGIINKTNNLGETMNVFQRLDQLQSAFEFQKKERFHEYNRLMKMIRQMECKHSSIIYDSQIKYFKSPPKPEVFFNTNNSLLKKVSTSSFLINKNGKQNKTLNQHKCQRNGINFDHIQGNLQSRIPIEENKLIPLNRYNPQKLDIISPSTQSQRESKIRVTQQELQVTKQKIQQKITERLKKEIQTLKQQTLIMSEKNTQYINELLKSHNITHQKDMKETHFNIQRLQNIIEQSHKSTMVVLQKVIKQIQNVQYVCQENMRAQLDNIYGQMYSRIKQVQIRTQQSIKNTQQKQSEKQLINRQTQSIFFLINEKNKQQSLWKKQYQQKIEKIQKQMLSNNILQAKTKQLQLFIKEQLKQLKNSPQNSIVTNLKELNDKFFYIENGFSRQIDNLYSKIEIISSSLSHQNTRMMNLQSSTQANLSIHSIKINQLSQDIISKNSLHQRDRQVLAQLQRYKAAQIDNQKLRQKNDQKKRQKQRQLINKMIDQKISNKIEIFRLISSRQIHSKYQKVQQQIMRIIDKHIRQVENFMTKISDQEQIIMKKFIQGCDSPSQKTTTINSKYNCSTVYSSCSTNI